MTLGETIARLRDQKGWSQGQLAVKARMKPTQVSRIERDVHTTISARNLARLAHALGVSTDYLCEEADWLPGRPHPKELAAAEYRLIEAIHELGSPRIRQKLLEQLTWFAESVLAAEQAQRFKRLAAVADEKEPYAEDEDSIRK